MKKNNKTNLIMYLGGSPELKVLDFLMENRRTSWNITQIETEAGIARSTIKAVILKLLKLKLICNEGMIGNSTLYEVNTDNEVIRGLMRLMNIIDEREVKEART